MGKSSKCKPHVNYMDVDMAWNGKYYKSHKFVSKAQNMIIFLSLEWSWQAKDDGGLKKEWDD